eukprot:TRINITY_DN43894_c0_g1_i1.p1 TRINITY_DN43894_c0_g1~~TRINITY_DN43894_c0_g1_i1.p1  ORF type:complete len:534 (+),score=83.50 TRINITY_DN43894_c0_g1_i1:94-1695(+)
MALKKDEELQELWQNTLAGRSCEDLSKEELRRLLGRGAPEAARKRLWPHWCRAHHQNLAVVEDEVAGCGQEVLDLIDKDVPRTMFDALSDLQRDSLRRLLACYARRNPEVGYCQGMSFLLAVFLLHGFEARDAFAGICLLVEEVCPRYHANGLEGFMRDVAVLSVMVQHFMPGVHGLIKAHDLPLSVLAMDHFLTLSACRWPLEATTRLYDVVLMEGTAAIFASFMVLLELYLPKAVESAHSEAHPDPETEGMDDVSPGEIIALFTNHVVAGVADDLDIVLQSSFSFIALAPIGLIEELRCDIHEDGLVEEVRRSMCRQYAATAARHQHVLLSSSLSPMESMPMQSALGTVSDEAPLESPSAAKSKPRWMMRLENAAPQEIATPKKDETAAQPNRPKGSGFKKKKHPKQWAVTVATKVGDTFSSFSGGQSASLPKLMPRWMRSGGVEGGRTVAPDCPMDNISCGQSPLAVTAKTRPRWMMRSEEENGERPVTNRSSQELVSCEKPAQQAVAVHDNLLDPPDKPKPRWMMRNES